MCFNHISGSFEFNYLNNNQVFFVCIWQVWRSFIHSHLETLVIRYWYQQEVFTAVYSNMATNDGDKAFNCPQCDKKFSIKSKWKYIGKSTPVKSHSAAPTVTTNAQHQAIWRDMKEFTQETNHSAAPSVTTNAQHQMISRNMKERTLVVNHSATLDAM